MTKFELQRSNLQRVLQKWKEAIDAFSSQGIDRDRDSAILRFELSFEVTWKLLQTFARHNGLESIGPRNAFENAHRLGLIEDEHLWYRIIGDRNLAIHVYQETLAEQLMSRLSEYQQAFQTLFDALPERL